MLEVKSVYKKFRDTQKDLFCDLSLYVRPKEFVSIIGPLGCGKTTLLEICAGLKNYHRGLCTFRKEPITKPGMLPYMPEGESLLPWYTLKRNIALVFEQEQGKIQAEIEAEQLLEEAGLSALGDCWPYELTLDKRQCGTLLRTMAFGETCMLLDEPFSLLDSLTKNEVLQCFKHMVKKHEKSVLLGTYDISDALFLSDRVYVMLPNRALQEIRIDVDTSDINSPSFRAKYKEVNEALRL